MNARVLRWERRTEVPLLLLGLGFLIAYAWPVLNPRVDHGIRTSLTTASWTIWAAFAVDYAIRISLADRRTDYAVRHWYDLALIAVPMLRPLRLLRLLAVARMLNRSATRGLVERVTVYVAGTAVMAVILGAIAVLDAEERSSHANIKTFGDALWWATSTVMTVGYGDKYPVTTTGRLVAVALMFVGIGVVGAVTASVAAWLIAQVRTESAE